MGQNTGASGKGKKEEELKKETVVEEEEEEEEVEEGGEEAEHDEQDGMSVHSPCKPASSALRKSLIGGDKYLVELVEVYESLLYQKKKNVESLLFICRSLDGRSYVVPDVDGGDRYPMELVESCESLPDTMVEQLQVELEIRLLEALEIYPPSKLRGIHRHFVLYGLTEHLRRSLNRQFSPDEVLKLLDRFYNLDMVKPDDEDAEIINQEEEFCLPQSYFLKEEP